MAKGKAVISSPTKVFFIRTMIRLFSIMPRFLGRWVGQLFAKISRWNKSRAFTTSKTNIEICLPDLTNQKKEAIVDQSLAHTGQLFSEAAKVWCNKNGESWIDAIYGEEKVKATLAQGKGVLITGAHIGNWEVALYYLGSRYKFHCMYRPPRQLEMDEVICKGRCKNSTTMVAGNSRGVMHLIESLKAGNVAAILSDQEPGRRAGVFVPFFGKPALTMTLVQKVQQKSNAEVYQIAAIRNEKGTFDIHLEPLDMNPEVEELKYAEKVNQHLENIIRRFPEQYQWSYKRFKTTEDGSKNIYRK
ncbi:lysophospholipid acyltransferase family protein [Kangiella koreensis]|uniref:Lipid A biosynthesis acyltransferase n=1 Tax=Kangiella koreensis (strain DSM 16069 / JCM 12317 / KCTC 12182 / SW-125) TaxID=523791 RepID=C7RAD7_KANKD|nr:lysophospholipid acyltransferase family protein [Kangiella koreensis]ACV28031.1 lipid A biosynthesis acyltransferase [Kangiella koreensis DSM 16069]